MIQLNKGRPGRGVWALAALALLLLPWPTARAEDKQQQKDREEVEGKIVTVGTAINPVAGVAFKVFFGAIDFAISFEDHPDAVAEEFKLVNQRLDVLDQRVTALEKAVREVQS